MGLKQLLYDKFILPIVNKQIDKIYTKFANLEEIKSMGTGMSIDTSDLSYVQIEKMAKESQVFIGLQIRKLAVIGKGGRYVNNKDKDIEEFINGNLNNLDFPFELYLERFLDYLEYGWSSSEICWENSKGYPILKGFIDMDQPYSNIYLKNNKGYPEVGKFETWGSEIPKEKTIYLVNESKNKNPYGTSVFQRIYKHWICSDKMTQFEASFLERMGIPPIILKVLGYHTANLNLANEIITKLHNESGVIMDSKWDIETLESQKKGDSYFRAAIEYHDMMILRGLLFPSGLLDSGKSGTYGLGSIRFEIFKWITNFTRNYLKFALEKQLFKGWVGKLTSDPEVIEAGMWKWKPYQELEWIRIGEGIKNLIDSGIIDPVYDADYVREEILGFDSLEDVYNKNEIDDRNKYLRDRKLFPTTVIRTDADRNSETKQGELELEKEKFEHEKENVKKDKKVPVKTKGDE